MRKLIIGLVLVLASASAYCDAAYWTGKMRYVPNYSRIPVVDCEYLYYGQRMWVRMNFTCENEVWMQ
jgi:hypothetical protein